MASRGRFSLPRSRDRERDAPVPRRIENDALYQSIVSLLLSLLSLAIIIFLVVVGHGP